MPGRLELPLADLRRSQCVLIRPVVRFQARGLYQRGLRIIEEIHPQAHTTEAEENLCILRFDLLRSQPIRERSLQFALPLGEYGRLPQRSHRVRLQRECRIVVLERARWIVDDEICAGKIERQFVRRIAGCADVLQDLDGFRPRAMRREEDAELDRGLPRNLLEALPVTRQGLRRGTVAQAEEVRRQNEQAFRRLREGRQHRSRQVDRPLIVALLRLGAGERQSRGHVRRIERQDALEQRLRRCGLALTNVDFREAQACADQAVVELNRLLQKDDAVVDASLLKADGAEHRICGGLRGGIGERPPRLPLRFIQPSLPDEVRGILQRLATVDG